MANGRRATDLSAWLLLLAARLGALDGPPRETEGLLDGVGPAALPVRAHHGQRGVALRRERDADRLADLAAEQRRAAREAARLDGLEPRRPCYPAATTGGGWVQRFRM